MMLLLLLVPLKVQLNSDGYKLRIIIIRSSKFLLGLWMTFILGYPAPKTAEEEEAVLKEYVAVIKDTQVMVKY